MWDKRERKKKKDRMQTFNGSMLFLPSISRGGGPPRHEKMRKGEKRGGGKKRDRWLRCLSSLSSVFIVAGAKRREKGKRGRERGENVSSSDSLQGVCQFPFSFRREEGL